MKNTIPLLLIVSFLCFSCTKATFIESTPAKPIDETITYEGHVKTIMTKHCTSCHGTSQAKGGLRLSNYNEVKASSSRSDSRMNNASNPMPPAGLISAQERAVFTKWIKDGLKEK